MPIQWYRQYNDEDEPEPVAEEEAHRKLSLTYKDIDLLLTGWREHCPIKTPYALYWFSND
jgi:hypothetical protein